MQLCFLTANWGTAYVMNVNPVRNLNDFSALKATYRKWNAGYQNVTFYAEAYLRDMTTVRVFDAIDDTIGLGALRVALGGPNMAASLSVVNSEHGETSFDTPGHGAGMLVDFLLRRNVNAVGNSIGNVKSFAGGIGSGTLTLWGVY